MTSVSMDVLKPRVGENAGGYVEQSDNRWKPPSPLPPPRNPGRGHERLGTAESTNSRLSLLRTGSGSTASGSIATEAYMNSSVSSKLTDTSSTRYMNTDGSRPPTYSNASAVLAAEKHNSMDEDKDSPSHYSFIKPKSSSNGSMRHAANVLYGSRKKSASSNVFDVGDYFIDFSSRMLQLLIIVLIVLSVSSLGLGVFILLRKSNDCSCSGPSVTVAASASAAEKMSNLTQKVDNLKAMAATLSTSINANAQKLNFMNQSINDKVSGIANDNNMVQMVTSLNISLLSQSRLISDKVYQQQRLLSQLKVDASQITQKTSLQSSNMSSSSTRLQQTKDNLWIVSTLTLTDHVQMCAQQIPRTLRVLTAAIRNGFLFDNCTIHKSSCELRQDASGAQTNATCGSVPVPGWRVLGASCYVRNNSQRAIATLHKPVAIGGVPPANEYVCYCRFDGLEDSMVVTHCGVNLFTCRIAS